MSEQYVASGNESDGDVPEFQDCNDNNNNEPKTKTNKQTKSNTPDKDINEQTNLKTHATEQKFLLTKLQPKCIAHYVQINSC